MSALLGNRQALGAAKATSGRQQAMVMPALPARAVGQSKTLWGSSNRQQASVASHITHAIAPPASKGAPAAQAVQRQTKVKMAPLDGNEAAAYIAYSLSDLSLIYPITPSTPMGELSDQWAAEGRKNVFGNVMSVTEMESETGAAGALHGGLAAGSLCTTFTASQGLLLMIPNMFKIAGELMPCVMHVTARSIAKHALSIFGDHQDVMAVRQCGWAMVCADTVQECQDMALVSHLATLRSSIPFVHFFDGFRTSHEINKIELIEESTIKALIEQPVYQEAMRHHARRALNPTHPHQRGTAQGPDTYFQMAEAANPYYDRLMGHIEATFDEVYAATGRKYSPFEYFGHPEADNVVVCMGSGCAVLEESVNHLVAQGKKVGLLKVRVFRPWSAEHLIKALPASAKRICVLDRTKESGAQAEPLFCDVATSIQEYEIENPTTPRRLVIAGRFGLSSKDFTPAQGIEVFKNLEAAKPRKRFTVGIIDDVTNLSLPMPKPLDTLPKGTTQAMFWGMGSDGTVGANKEAVKIIANNTDMYAQAYFFYDAHKSGGVTISHLRFGPNKIGSSYLIEQADYVGVHLQSYMQKYDVLSKVKPGGVLVLNTTFTDVASLEKYLPAPVKRRLAEVKPQFYVIDGRAVAEATGLGKRINMVMQTVFFQLSGVLPIEKAIELLKKSIEKAYGKKGPAIVAMNHKAVDDAVASLKKIEIPASWAQLDTPKVEVLPPMKGVSAERLKFMEEVAKPMLALEGDLLPVSVFSPEGFVPPGTTVIERRAIAATVPIWKQENCTQCNVCAFVCPHAAIRPFLAKEDELKGAPAGFSMVKAKGAGMGEYQFRIQVSPYDCTGCSLCTNACPDDALVDKPIAEYIDIEDKHWAFSSTLPIRDDILNKGTVKGSQFAQPLMEFSGACEGCGETPYVKLLTQLYGDRLIIANSTGCSSIWGASAPSNPYTVNKDGHGPAWANSLFEDTAQFGLGIALSAIHRRQTLHRFVNDALKAEAGVPADVKSKLTAWEAVWQDAAASQSVGKELIKMFEADYQNGKSSSAIMEKIYHERAMFVKPSIWIIGGDGWAYDIGYGGLDHIMASGEDVNILVLDTEMYSNTGGQKSKSTPLGAVAKFAAGGKLRPKKDLGAIAMSYQDVYVASCCLEANFNQTIKAFAESEAHKGVSMILAYSPCVIHGIEGGMCNTMVESREAVESGYWPLYRYNPGNEKEKRFQLDSKRIKSDVETFLKKENRFTTLNRKAPETAKALAADMSAASKERQERYKAMAEGLTPPPS